MVDVENVAIRSDCSAFEPEQKIFVNLIEGSDGTFKSDHEFTDTPTRCCDALIDTPDVSGVFGVQLRWIAVIYQ